MLIECSVYALDNRIEFGIWAGMTERQRRALLVAYLGVRWSERFTNPPPVG
ncbi:WhiB family transcriptional regulator [Rhodococcus opacus RKJ300 = JCM 13270]|uniref:WhiB family transcriptional regulator n=1 Tax=Rhodococcus opacus RKJ300 = JCM 13270 TaxID=1165867 RepID=I0WHH5_RHOOP|nr:WhiB family transcriptional regulator [Rhodococcus opacus RKJ300 = JCM 13270]